VPIGKSVHVIFTGATRLEHNCVADPGHGEDTVPVDRAKVSHVIALLRVSEATRKGRRPGTHSLARAVRGSATPRIARVLARRRSRSRQRVQLGDAAPEVLDKRAVAARAEELD